MTTTADNPTVKTSAEDDPQRHAGYLVWGVAALVIAGTELAAVFDAAWWPTISATTGHLEDKWPALALIVVFLIVYGAYCVFPRGEHTPVDLTKSALDGKDLTANGRRVQATIQTRKGEPNVQTWYVPTAIAITCGAVLTAILANHAHGNAPFIGAYILYGMVAIVWVIVPSILAYLGAKEVGFPTFVWTLHHLYHRWPFLAVVLLAALTVLLIHLALYPWPSIIHDLQHHAPSKQSP
jgi:hypothetical protein